MNTSVSLVKKEVIRGKMREPHRCDCLMPHVTGTPEPVYGVTVISEPVYRVVGLCVCDM